ncbi:hypothetical protein JCM16303_005198 [Sporobolomyces ruberrimus]
MTREFRTCSPPDDRSSLQILQILLHVRARDTEVDYGAIPHSAVMSEVRNVINRLTDDPTVGATIAYLNYLYGEIHLSLNGRGRRRIAWIPYLKSAVERGIDHSWPEAPEAAARKSGFVMMIVPWVKVLEEVHSRIREGREARSSELTAVPSWEEVTRKALVGPLLSRDFAFYSFYLDSAKAALDASRLGSDFHDSKEDPDRSALSRSRALSGWLTDPRHPCRKIRAEQWESDRVTYKHRTGVFLVIDAGVSAFNCFSSTSHEDENTYHYSPSVLPQLSASSRANSNRTSPTRTPLLKRPSLRFDKKRPSYGSGNEDGEKRALRKAMIGKPTGFQHVGGSGLNEKTEIPPVPVRPRVEMSEKPPLSQPLAPLSTTSTPPPRPPRERPFSLPAPSRTPLGDTSNRTLSPPSTRVARRQSLTPPPKRKPAPPITHSLIQQAGTEITPPLSLNSRSIESKLGLEQNKAKAGGRGGGQGNNLGIEIEELFTKNELKVIEKYEGVADGTVETVGSTIKGLSGVGGQETAWKGAMKEIELALAG